MSLIGSAVVGVVVLFIGILILTHVFQSRQQEIADWGGAGLHLFGFTAALAVCAIGIFFLHVPVLYYVRSLRKHK
jgi:uncharacterized membrane protein HdeD (DUF308 family)